MQRFRIAITGQAPDDTHARLPDFIRHIRDVLRAHGCEVEHAHHGAIDFAQEPNGDDAPPIESSELVNGGGAHVSDADRMHRELIDTRNANAIAQRALYEQAGEIDKIRQELAAATARLESALASAPSTLPPPAPLELDATPAGATHLATPTSPATR